MQETLAKIFSFLFHFIFLGPISFLIINSKYGFGEGRVGAAYPILLLLFYIVAPLVTTWLLMRSGKVADFDVTDRSQRHLLNGIVLCYIAVFCVITFLLPVPEIFKLNILYSLVFSVLFAGITFYWKISYHMGGVGWFVAVLTQVFSFNAVTLSIAFIITVLTAWSRIVLKKHTFWQTFVGFWLSVGLYYVLNAMFFNI